MQCEVCGQKIIGKVYRVIIEGAKMTTCDKCSRLGSDYWKPESEGLSLRQPVKSEIKPVPISPLVKRQVPMDVPEDLEIAEDFGLRVRRAREKLGLDHENLGRKIGEKASVISKIESGKMVPDQKLAAKLEHALRIKLLVPFSEPEKTLPSHPPSSEVTLGEIVRLKSEKRRHSENESDRGL